MGLLRMRRAQIWNRRIYTLENERSKHSSRKKLVVAWKKTERVGRENVRKENPPRKEPGKQTTSSNRYMIMTSNDIGNNNKKRGLSLEHAAANVCVGGGWR